MTTPPCPRAFRPRVAPRRNNVVRPILSCANALYPIAYASPPSTRPIRPKSHRSTTNRRFAAPGRLKLSSTVARSLNRLRLARRRFPGRHPTRHSRSALSASPTPAAQARVDRNDPWTSASWSRPGPTVPRNKICLRPSRRIAVGGRPPIRFSKPVSPASALNLGFEACLSRCPLRSAGACPFLGRRSERRTYSRRVGRGAPIRHSDTDVASTGCAHWVVSLNFSRRLAPAPSVNITTAVRESCEAPLATGCER
jgi:hypothetical protein